MERVALVLPAIIGHEGGDTEQALQAAFVFLHRAEAIGELSASDGALPMGQREAHQACTARG